MSESKRVELPLIGGTGGYFGDQFSQEKTLNMFVAEAPGTNMKALITIPGSVPFFTNSEGEITRRLFNNKDTMFGVFSEYVVSFDSSILPSAVGTLNSTTGYIGVQGNNSQQILFVDNVDGWVYDFSGAPTFTQVVAPAFTELSGPLDVDFLDGHMIVGYSSSNIWAISDLDNAASWDALNRAKLTSGSDERITGIRVINRRIFIFGRNVTERWYNSGAASSFPFVRDDNLILPYGCAATDSIATGSISQAQEVLVWLASQEEGPPTIRFTDGGESKPLSDAAIDYKIERMTTTDDAHGYMYRIDGHSFYLINFVAEKQTFVYDFDSGVWHEQAMINNDPYFSCCHAYFQGKHFLGHYEHPTFSELSSDFVVNGDENIHCLRRTHVLAAPTNERILIDKVQMEMRQGTGHKSTEPKLDGTYDGFNLDPKVYLSHSSNGGATYSQQRAKGVGKVGEYDWITTWTGFPLSDRHSFQIESFNGVKSIWINLAVQLSNEGY